MTPPFLKWPGGKRWASKHISCIIRPRLTGTYYEPFLGGGSIYFCLRPERAVLADINSDLIETYRVVQKHPTRLVNLLKTMSVDRATYYSVRAEIPRGRIRRAARFLYLNRTAFGGIYWLNRHGEFDVPFGGGDRTPRLLWKQQLLVRASAYLRDATLLHRDFEALLDQAGPGDVAYCDPTYTVTHDRNCFVRYNERTFSWADQQRLAEAASRAARRGAFVLVSNANHESVIALYPDAEVRRLERTSCVSRKVEYRRPVYECLFLLGPERGDGAGPLLT